MEQLFKLTGLTCNACKEKISQLLSSYTDILTFHINENLSEVTIKSNHGIHIEELKNILKPFPKYNIHEIRNDDLVLTKDNGLWEKLKIYKPVLLLLVFNLGISYLCSTDGMSWMQYFMSGFFISFSFFKLLDIEGFANSYSEYDVIASRWKSWAYVYPFLEMSLGILFLLYHFPLVTNGITLIIMSISLVGVLRAVTNRKKIKCACLGSIFNLPMSNLTIFEDALMIAMSLIMIWKLL